MASKNLGGKLLGLALVTAAAAPTRAARKLPVFDIPRMAKVTVDGKSADWADRGYRAGILTPPEGALAPAADHDARLRLGWNDKGMLVLLTVRDDEWIESPAEDQLWASDAIELFLVPRKGGKDIAQWVISPGMAANQPSVRWHFHDARKTPALQGLPARIDVARTRTRGGYVLEALLPWRSLAIQPKRGLEVGLQVYVNDRDGDDEGLYQPTWYPALGAYADSTKVHRCRLAEKPSPPRAFRTTLSYDLDRVAMRVAILAGGEHVGKEVALVAPGRPEEVPAKGKLAGDSSGRATAELLVPLPPVGTSPGRLALRLGGKDVGEVYLGEYPSADLSRCVMAFLEGKQRRKWTVRLAPADRGVARIVAAAAPPGSTVAAKRDADGKAVSLTAETYWGEAVVVFQLAGPPEGKLHIRANGHGRTLDLKELTRQAVDIMPGEAAGWAPGDLLRVSAEPGDVACGLAVAAAANGRRREALGLYLAAARQFKGTEWGVHALMGAAGTYAAHCMVEPFGPGAWDHAIRLYRRVVRDYPASKQAANAPWAVATCTGCWARYGCCRQNQGKADWPAAIRLYRRLHETATDRGSECDALRRVAEIQCNCLGAWREGLATYRKILAEFDSPVPASPHWTSRTCGTHNGTDMIDRDLLDFTFPKLLARTWTHEEAARLRDEFLQLAPPQRTIRFHTLYLLAERLRKIGESDRARQIDARLGLCKTYLVVGPFDNNRQAMSRTVHEVEKDVLAGRVELKKTYTASLDTGRTGKAMWLKRPTISFGRIWKSSWQGGENSGLYALTYVRSPKARAAHLRVGSSGPVRAWLNGHLVLDTPGGDFSMVDQLVAPVALKAGRNELFLKLCVATGFCENHCRITDKQGAALADLAYSVPDVPAGNERASDFLRPPPEPAARAEKAEADLRYGFRHDPMAFVRGDTSLQGALVRTLILKKPKPTDQTVLKKEIDALLAGQQADGRLADPDERGVLATTGEGLLRLLELGCPPDRKEVRRAASALAAAVERLPAGQRDKINCAALRALVRVGKAGHPAVKASFERLARTVPRRMGHGCPWADQIHFMTFWAGRKSADIAAEVDAVAEWMDAAVEPAGCSSKLGLCHTPSLVRAVATVDHPVCRRIARRLVPMILRSQRADGGWGDDEDATFWVFRLLSKHGLLEALRKLPPLPPDWRVVRSIPAPGAEPWALAWDGRRLWVHDARRDAPAAIAVAPKDGKVLQRIELPRLADVSPLGVWDGCLTLTTPGKDRRLYKIDTDTGRVLREVPLGFLGEYVGSASQMGDKLVVCDHWDSGVSLLDAKDPTRRIGHVRTPAGTPTAPAAAGKELWLVDVWAPAVVRTNLKGELLDWAEKPFGGVGIAWDGRQLWALDAERKRICVVERSRPGRPAAQQAKAWGFRHDPMKWVETDTSLEAALVRRTVFERPGPSDEAILGKRIAEILSAQRSDGALSDHVLHAVTQTGGRLAELIELGALRDRPELKRALAYVRRHGGKDKGDTEISVGMARALALMGAAEPAALQAAVRRLIDRADDWIGLRSGCPWTPVVQLKSVWRHRTLDPRAEAVLARGLKGIVEKLNEAGCASYNDPWGYLDLAGTVNHPLGREIAVRQVPMILRSQRSDGGWGRESVKVFRALKRYGLLDRLRKRPPLPADFRVARSIPAPAGDLFTMTWGDGRLWIYDRKANEAVAVSPKDGKVVRRLKLPVTHARGIGWWAGRLAVTRQDPAQQSWKTNPKARALVRIDPKTGKVEGRLPLKRMHQVWAVTQAGGKLVIADGFLNAVGIFDAARPDKPEIRTLGAPGAIGLAAEGGAIWHTDWLLTGVLFKSDLDGRLLDWGTAPFEGGRGDWAETMSVRGLTFDGRRLWALDTKGKRICVIERTRPTEVARGADSPTKAPK